MAKKMLIDATHQEQTRVAVVDGTRLEEFDFETASRKQLKGNIYLAKVIRIEPSLQAAFVEYGGNRHGFLAFSEIHHDYYRIPVADRQALEEALREQRAHQQRYMDGPGFGPQPFAPDAPDGGEDDAGAPFLDEEINEEHIQQSALPPAVALSTSDIGPVFDPFNIAASHGDADNFPPENFDNTLPPEAEMGEAPQGDELPAGDVVPVEMVGGDEAEGQREQRRRRFIRRYKIQEVIKRGQIMLIQVVKEERGNKGAALTTYLSLAGRYCVLMPNTDKGGGISRKITSMQDRRRMKEILDELDTPDGMAVILRTAGMERSKIEVKRDLEYLMRLWESIRDATMKSIAPALIYEEADLIKRAIRDLYVPEIDTILVEGEEGYHKARDFMRMLMPSHARRVHHYRGQIIPLFFRYQVENQINGLHSSIVQLRSGGYIVINQTEALVAIDVNSGRATRERNIEETAYRTNLEAAEEVARQLRLRDLAGLIVIDFIDMEDGRNNANVERRLKDAMRHDRARLQIGRISHFGLLELSRQRLRPSLLDLNFEKCPHCHGTGNLRLVESSALLALHAMEEEGIRQNASEIIISMPTKVSLYILNNKRELMADIEKRYGLTISIKTKDDVTPPDFPIERVRAKKAHEQIPIHSINEQQLFAETDRQLGLSADDVSALGSMEGDDGPVGESALDRMGDDEDPVMPLDNSGSAFAGDNFGEERRRYQGQQGQGDGRRRGRRGGRRRGGRGGYDREPRPDNRQDNRQDHHYSLHQQHGSYTPPVMPPSVPSSVFDLDTTPRDPSERPAASFDQSSFTPPPAAYDATYSPGFEGAGSEAPRDFRHNDGDRPPRNGRNRRGGRDRRRNRDGQQPQYRYPPRNPNYSPEAPQQQDMPLQQDYAPPSPQHTPAIMPAGVVANNPAPPQDVNVNVVPEKKKSGWWQRLTGGG